MRGLAVIFALASAFWPAISLAGVVASPHDIQAQGYVFSGDQQQKKGSVCNYCHVPHKAKGARLWATTPPSLRSWGDVGPLCYSCHDGVAIVSPNVDASNTAFNPKSHGLSIEDLPKGDDVSGSGFPYTGESNAHNIECSTCHNPHDNTNRPFLRSPITEICQKCHQRRENSGYNLGNAESTHPVHKLPKDEVEGDSPIDLQDDFKVPFPSEYPSENGAITPGVHWTLGGHLAEGDDGSMECITCHSIHGKEAIGPQSDRLLSMDPVKKNSNEFCEGCHRGKRADELGEPPFPNPGGTELPRTYHPADDDEANGPGRIVDIIEPEGWEFGEARELLCTTCHKPHDALQNSPILRPMQKSATFCEECHSTENFNHHPSGASTGGGVNSGKPHASTRVIQIPDDIASYGHTYGTPQQATLYCSSCHRAHNAKCEPILVIECAPGGTCDICLNCHPKFNPTWQTDDKFKSTHFMGDPTAAVVDKIDLTTGQPNGTQPGYSDDYPPINRETWPESGMKSAFGGGVPGNEITCCSCHSFGAGGVTAGDADYSPYDGTSLAPGYITSDLTNGLLARAGQFKEWLESDVNLVDVGGSRGQEQRVTKYLCTGCHGLTPNTHPEDIGSEGFTHPMMDADGTKITPAGGAHLTFNEHVNCESCHSAHEASSWGGFYILRDATLNVKPEEMPSVPDPYRIWNRLTEQKVEFAPVCHRCHIDY